MPVVVYLVSGTYKYSTYITEKLKVTIPKMHGAPNLKDAYALCLFMESYTVLYVPSQHYYKH